MDEPDGRRGSDVLDAIWDKVASKPERSDSATLLFRAKALDRLDVAAEVDNQLPLVSRRSWLLLAGVGLLVLAFAVWASLTPSVTSVQAVGRIVAAPGAVPVTSPVAGVLDGLVSAGTVVAPGDPLAQVTTGSGSAAVTAPTAGTVWQLPVVPGGPIEPGQTVLTLLPPGSTDAALLVLPEAQALSVQPGMAATIGGTPGTVTAVSAPLTADDAGARVGISLPVGADYVLVTVALDASLPAGAAANGQVILSDGTVISRLLGR